MAAKTPKARRAFLMRLAAGLGGATVGAALVALALAKDFRGPAYAKARAENNRLLHARGLWDDRCARCHGLAGTGGEKAPDLHDYDSRAWIRGFLQAPGGRLYMGPAKLEDGMKPVDATPEELEGLVEAVYAETAPADLDAARAARGRDLLVQKDCDTCHDFDGSGENEGPNLKGRGTFPWVVAVINDAGHGLLYGERNKMPKLGAKLPAADIEDLARFVIGLRK